MGGVRVVAEWLVSKKSIKVSHASILSLIFLNVSIKNPKCEMEDGVYSSHI